MERSHYLPTRSYGSIAQHLGALVPLTLGQTQVGEPFVNSKLTDFWMKYGVFHTIKKRGSPRGVKGLIICLPKYLNTAFGV